MASASSLAHFNSSDTGEKGLETIEIDPQYAQGLGMAQGDTVCPMDPDREPSLIWDIGGDWLAPRPSHGQISRH